MKFVKRILAYFKPKRDINIRADRATDLYVTHTDLRKELDKRSTHMLK